MAIKVIYNTYIEICEDYMYGKHFLDFTRIYSVCD